MMIMIGVFQGLAGLVAILDNAPYVATDAYPFRLNTPTWGWIDLIVGLLMAGAGWAVFSGRTWAGSSGSAPHRRRRLGHDRRPPRPDAGGQCQRVPRAV
jgi:hypothetical protein